MRANQRPRVLHASLAVTDLDRSLAFYQAVFGARVVLLERGMSDLIARTAGLPGLTCDLAQLSIGDSTALLELIAFHGVPAGREDHAPVRPGHGHICIGVTNLDEAIATSERHGATRIGEIVAYPEGRAVYLRAPGGSVLELEEVAE
ncbi:MAG TPA: VOC family protein [Streptosporangiaceae bacterium]|jgi:catechol 2,3-dioxygenase-like lactoylglutathione lyase family enzyme|nr:VOC family protein [Streptosporangiaceae bacterium]